VVVVMAKLAGANDVERLKDLCSKNFKSQAVWFLNAFWDDGLDKEAEKCWSYVQTLQKLDLQKGADGNEVDELNQHRFLEAFHETQTVREMRDNLRSSGAIGDSVKMIPLSHYLIFKYKIDWHVLVNAAQGDNRKEIEEAQRKLDEVQAAFKEADSKAQQAKAALREAEARESEAKSREAQAKTTEAEAKAKEADAKQKEANAKSREAEAKAAQEELQAALAELHSQEHAYNNKTTDLKRRSEDENTGVVNRNKAKAELAQHLAEDPLPLRRAKITQEAAVKKADKASQLATDARAAAEAALKQATSARASAEESAREATAARSSAEKARQHAANAKAAAEEALEEMQRKVDEAEAYFLEVKSKPGSAKGSIWWMERELHEAKAYLPTKKGGYSKKSV